MTFTLKRLYPNMEHRAPERIIRSVGQGALCRVSVEGSPALCAFTRELLHEGRTTGRKKSERANSFTTTGEGAVVALACGAGCALSVSDAHPVVVFQDVVNRRFLVRAGRFLWWSILFVLMAVAPGRAEQMRVVVPVASVFLHPKVASERVTQVLLGNRVDVLQTRGSWIQVAVCGQYRLADGYHGWMLKSELCAASRVLAHLVSVSAVRTKIRTEPGATAPVVTPVFLGSRLEIAGPVRSDWLHVRIPGTSREGWISASQVALKGSLKLHGASDLIRTALALRGTRYLWGGLSAAGIDCSGLVYETYHLYGILLPRDADQQFEMGIPVSRVDLRPGDLVFFGRSQSQITHVAIYLGQGRIVEAAGAHGVSINLLSRRNAAYKGGRRVVGVSLTMPRPSP